MNTIKTLLLLGFAIIVIARRTHESRSLSRRQYGNTENQLVNGSCAAITIIYARGTLDPGNLGESVGPPFFDALVDIVGESNLVIQGVPYPAQIWGFAHGGSPVGSQNMADLVALVSRIQ